MSKIHSNSYAKLQIASNSQNAISLTRNSVYYDRIKHVNIVYHYIQKKITIKRIKLEYIQINLMSVDDLIKPLKFIKFKKFVEMLDIIESMIEAMLN